MTPERIAELRALAAAATPGPWLDDSYRVHVGDPYAKDGPYYVIADLKHRDEPSDDGFAGTVYGNRAFIAAARTALPEALDAIERVRKLAISIQDEYLGEWDASAAILAALEGKP